MSESEGLKGVVKWFNDAKGFGFIEHTTGRDVFVHYSVIEAEGFKTLKDGEEVSYAIKEGPKGLHAVKVVRSPAQEAQEASDASDSGESDTGEDDDEDSASDETNADSTTEADSATEVDSASETSDVSLEIN